MRIIHVKGSIILLAFFVLSVKTEAQIQSAELDLHSSEKIVKNLFDSMRAEGGAADKIVYNDKILKIFRSVLNDQRSFSFPFDSLNQIGKIHSSDSLLRIFSWEIPINSGYKHFGFVQYRSKKGELALYELNDKSNDIVNPKKNILNKENWYGAVYYKIVPVSSKKIKQYTLFGFDSNNMLSNKKIIEIISIDANEKLVFGKQIFKTKKEVFSRIIFEYSARSVMMLKYDERYEMIVFDHLSPQKPLYKGQFMFYVPDLSYDGWKFEKGEWIFMSDIDLRNPKK